MDQVDHVCLACIALAAGSELRLSELRRSGVAVGIVTGCEP